MAELAVTLDQKIRWKKVSGPIKSDYSSVSSNKNHIDKEDIQNMKNLLGQEKKGVVLQKPVCWQIFFQIQFSLPFLYGFPRHHQKLLIISGIVGTFIFASVSFPLIGPPYWKWLIGMQWPVSETAEFRPRPTTARPVADVAGCARYCRPQRPLASASPSRFHRFHAKRGWPRPKAQLPLADKLNF